MLGEMVDNVSNDQGVAWNKQFCWASCNEGLKNIEKSIPYHALG